MRKNLSKTGYVGVYQHTDGNTFFFSSKLSSDILNKKRVTKYGFKTAEEAYKAKLEYEEKTKHEIDIGYNRDRLGYLESKYLEWKKPAVKPSTYRHHVLTIKKYLKDYEDYTIEEFCRNSILDRFRGNIAEADMSTNQKNRVMSLLNDMFRYGGLINYVKQEYVNLITVKMTRIAERATDIKHVNENFWSIPEWEKFLSVIPKHDRWYYFFALIGHLGCRIGEFRGLMNKHFDPVKSTIRIEQQAITGATPGKTIITTPKTRGSTRTITISKQMCDLLIEYRTRYKKAILPDSFLFFNTVNPTSLSTIRRKFVEYTQKAGLRHITLHGIRHSNCTWLLSGKLDVQQIGQVSRRLGHSSTHMTLDVYMHIHQEESPVILSTLDNIITDTRSRG